MGNLSTIQSLIVWAVPVIFAITVHEVAHGYVANRYGDSTARMLGRLTLNPVKHVDLLGTLVIPGLLLVMGTGFVFGWAKPVPVNPRNLPNPRRDMAVVAAAGPASNLVMAIAWALLLKLAAGPLAGVAWVSVPLLYMSLAGIFVNLVLMVLNLIPVPPLDGGRVLVGLLPAYGAQALYRLEPYGLFIIIALLATGVLGRIIRPVIGIFDYLILNTLGIGGFV